MRFLLICALSVLIFSVAGCKKPAAADIQGAWEGTLQAGELALRLVLKISRAADGSYTATADSIDQGMRDIPVTSIVVNQTNVKLELKGLVSSFSGEIKNRGTELAGNWEQAGQSLPVVFKKTTQPSTIPDAMPAQAYAPRKGSDLQGYWKGALEIGRVKLRLGLKLAEAADGRLQGTIYSIDQGGKDLPITAVRYTKPALRLELDGIGGLFEGNLSADGSEIAGDWTQGGRTTPLVFKRGEPETDTALPAAAYIPARETDLQGYWNGAIQVKEIKLRLALKIAKMPDGSFRGSLDSLDQGARNIPMSTISFTNPVVHLEWSALGASYHGELAAGKMTGTYQQLRQSFPLDFTRTNSPGTK